MRIDLTEMECEEVDCILVAQNRVQCRAIVNLCFHRSEQAFIGEDPVLFFIGWKVCVRTVLMCLT
jgi:hypothetical protein